MGTIPKQGVGGGVHWMKDNFVRFFSSNSSSKMFVMKKLKGFKKDFCKKKITIGAEFLRIVIFEVKQQAKYQKVGNF